PGRQRAGCRPHGPAATPPRAFSARAPGAQPRGSPRWSALPVDSSRNRSCPLPVSSEIDPVAMLGDLLLPERHVPPAFVRLHGVPALLAHEGFEPSCLGKAGLDLLDEVHADSLLPEIGVHEEPRDMRGFSRHIRAHRAMIFPPTTALMNTRVSKSRRMSASVCHRGAR